MGGNFPFPVKYGYATVGRVEHGPAELIDRTVFALHPHQERFGRLECVALGRHQPQRYALVTRDVSERLE